VDRQKRGLWSARADAHFVADGRGFEGARVSTVPVRPAAYVRVADAAAADDPDMTSQRELVVGQARRLGWPMPAMYADAGPPGGQYAALAEAITAGRHDAVIVARAGAIGDDLAQIEAFDLHCRRHGVRLCGEYGWPVADTRELFDVIRHVRDFTVTDEHLRLLRHAYVSWFDAEFGAPSIDPKRPYGNSNVYGDMAEVLGLADGECQDEAEEDWPPPEAKWRFLRLHVETAIVLQIALATGEFRTAITCATTTGQQSLQTRPGLIQQVRSFTPLQEPSRKPSRKHATTLS
jgi:hypothetical protein